MPTKKKVLFICVHNSARSQMAEEWLKRLAPGDFEVESAGLEPGTINPLVAAVMAEVGVDLSTKKTQSAFELFKSGKTFDYVITVCDDANEKRCPTFPGMVKRLHIPFTDPSTLAGSEAEKLEVVRGIRDGIKTMIEALKDELKAGSVGAFHEPLKLDIGALGSKS